jgi:TRAP-type mannitol/chloroaromatic compound transport system permease small subunit
LLTWFDAVVDRMGRLAAWAMVALVLLVSTNVLVRYFLHEGSVWGQELEWHLLMPIALFGIPYSLANDEHVRVDILYERFSDKGRDMIDLFAAVVGVGVALLLIKFSIPYVEQSWRNGEGSPDPGGLPARYALKALLPLGFLILFIQQFASAVRAALRLSGKASKTPE